MMGWMRGRGNGNEYLPKNMAQPHTIQIDASESADFELLRSHQWYNDGCYCCVFTMAEALGRLHALWRWMRDLNESE